MPNSDNSTKSVLARACDPHAAREFASVVKPMIGNAEYVPTTDDADFFAKLEERQWSVVFFAPGACRFSAANQAIPGGNVDTRGWTLDQYREVVRRHQGDDVTIVETLDERETVAALNQGLASARETAGTAVT